jgi:DNA-binding CsgD family transcriptional regulator
MSKWRFPTSIFNIRLFNIQYSFRALTKRLWEISYFFLAVKLYYMKNKPTQGKVSRGTVAAAATEPPVYNLKLTAREKIFLSLLTTELSYKEIASQMFVSPRTIEDYKASLCRKFRAKTRVGLVVFAMRHHLVEPEMLDDEVH